MAVTTTMTYGWMIVSALAHLSIPFFLQWVTDATTLYMYILAASLFINLVIHGILQVSSCPSTFDISRVFKGGAIGTAVAAALVALPVFVEGARTIVSQISIDHLPEVDDTIESEAEAGKTLAPEEYQKQTLAEINVGARYWGAFAGAYGVGAGALISMTCG